MAASSSSNDLILDSAPQLVMDFSSWNELPSNVQTTLAEHQQDNLQSEHGPLLYGAASPHKRYAMLNDALCGLVHAPSSDQMPALIAEALHPYLAHKAQAMVRVQNGARSQAFFVADETTQTYNLATETKVKQELRALLDDLLPLIEDNFLIEGSAAKTRNALQLKELLKDLDEIPEVEPLMLKLRSLEQALEIHTILRGATKNAIVKCFMDTCKKQPSPLEDLVWFPCPQGDVNLDTGLTRQRWQFFNVSGMANANYTVPLELAQQPLDQWNNEDQATYFGSMDDLFAKISAGDAAMRREMLISLYLQLRGGHDLIVLWLGQGHGGKLLQTLLRKVLGSLGSVLNKSALFRTKEKGKMERLQESRCVMIDDITQDDVFNEPAMKRLTCAPILLCCTALPKLPTDEAILRRMRIIQFPDQPDLTDVGEPSEEQFLNYVILHGQQVYHQNMKQHQQPLIHQRLAHQPDDEVKPKAATSTPNHPRETLKEWFARRIQPEPGATVSLADLTNAYTHDHCPPWHQPEQVFYARFQKELPDIPKSFYPSASGPIL